MERKKEREEREKERGGERDRDRDRDRQTESGRETDRQTDRKTGRQTETEGIFAVIVYEEGKKKVRVWGCVCGGGGRSQKEVTTINRFLFREIIPHTETSSLVVHDGLSE